MEKPDWAKIYAAMDKRLDVKCEQLPAGEQIGGRTQAAPAQIKKS